jgi:hypothetical protein
MAKHLKSKNSRKCIKSILLPGKNIDNAYYECIKNSIARTRP